MEQKVEVKTIYTPNRKEDLLCAKYKLGLNSVVLSLVIFCQRGSRSRKRCFEGFCVIKSNST